MLIVWYGGFKHCFVVGVSLVLLGLVTINFCLTRKMYRHLVHFGGVSAEHKNCAFVQRERKHEYSLRDVTTCSLVNRYRLCGGMCCFHLQCRYCFASWFQSPPSLVLLVDGKRGDDPRLEVGVSALLRGSKWLLLVGATGGLAAAHRLKTQSISHIV
jgi:hypothetical protein